MSWFRRQEEYLVDRFAAGLMEKNAFAVGLVRAVTAISAFHMDFGSRPGRKISLLQAVNAEFYERLMSMRREPSPNLAWPQWPNYFDILRSHLSDFNYANGRRALEQEVASHFSTHPSTPDRIRALGVSLDSIPWFPNPNSQPVVIDKTTEQYLSKEFATVLRPHFYSSHLSSSSEPKHALESGNVTVFICMHKGCERFGQPEIVLSANEIILFSGQSSETFRWDELVACSIQVGGSEIDPFTTAAMTLLAAFREVPLNRSIALEAKNGRRMKIKHWHLDDNMWELEMLVEHFAKAARQANFSPLLQIRFHIFRVVAAFLCAIAVFLALDEITGRLTNWQEFAARQEVENFCQGAAMISGFATWYWAGSFLQRLSLRRRGD